MGDVMRRYWFPIAATPELEESSPGRFNRWTTLQNSRACARASTETGRRAAAGRWSVLSQSGAQPGQDVVLDGQHYVSANAYPRCHEQRLVSRSLAPGNRSVWRT